MGVTIRRVIVPNQAGGAPEFYQQHTTCRIQLREKPEALSSTSIGVLRVATFCWKAQFTFAIAYAAIST
jgi:hypothetical protein